MKIVMAGKLLKKKENQRGHFREIKRRTDEKFIYQSIEI